jgi:hypothetical protein
MRTFMSSLLIWAAITVAAIAMTRPLPQAPPSGDSPSSLHTQWIARDPIESPPALQQRFGRDTLLYFPMAVGQPNLPVAFTVAALPAR